MTCLLIVYQCWLHLDNLFVCLMFYWIHGYSKKVGLKVYFHQEKAVLKFAHIKRDRLAKVWARLKLPLILNSGTLPSSRDRVMEHILSDSRHNKEF